MTAGTVFTGKMDDDVNIHCTHFTLKCVKYSDIGEVKWSELQDALVNEASLRDFSTIVDDLACIVLRLPYICSSWQATMQQDEVAKTYLADLKFQQNGESLISIW